MQVFRSFLYSPNFRNQVLPLLVVAAYLYLMRFFHAVLRPDQIFVIFTLAALVLFGRSGGKRFLYDWAPFTIFIILYDGTRGLVDNLAGHINVSGPYLAEKFLFGWMSNGQVFPFLLQWVRQTMGNSLLVNILDGAAGLLYSVHFLIPFILGWILWGVLKDRKTFYAFIYTLTILNILALATFFLYPAAPPWYVWKFHFMQPGILSFSHGDPAALLNFDKLIKFPLFSSIYNELNPNPFAAIPSLHGSYPLLTTIFIFRKWKNIPLRIASVIYVACVWFSAIYLNHHYLIDLLIGAIYVFVSIKIYDLFLYPKVILPLVFKKVETESAPNSTPIKHRPILASCIFATCVMVLLFLTMLSSKKIL